MSQLKELFDKTVAAVDFNEGSQLERAQHILSTAQLADWTITNADELIPDDFWLSIPQEERRCILAAFATTVGEVLVAGV